MRVWSSVEALLRPRPPVAGAGGASGWLAAAPATPVGPAPSLDDCWVSLRSLRSVAESGSRTWALLWTSVWSSEAVTRATTAPGPTAWPSRSTMRRSRSRSIRRW